MRTWLARYRVLPRAFPGGAGHRLSDGECNKDASWSAFPYGSRDLRMNLNRKCPRWTLLLVILLFTFPAFAADDSTIKVGVLHSLSGTMAISESALKDTV